MMWLIMWLLHVMCPISRLSRRDDKAGGDCLSARSTQEGDECSKDSMERYEGRLGEVGRRAVEMYALAHIFTERVEVAFNEAECIRRQDELIREEEEMGRRCLKGHPSCAP